MFLVVFDSDVIDPVSSVASNLPHGTATEYFRPEVKLRSTNNANFDIANALAFKNVKTSRHKLAEPVNNPALADALKLLETYDKTKLGEYKKQDQVIQGVYVFALAGNEPLEHRAIYIGHYARKILGEYIASSHVNRAYKTLSDCRHFHNGNERKKKDITTDAKCIHILKLMEQTKRQIVIHVLDTAGKFDPENWEGILVSTQPPNSYNVDTILYDRYKQVNAKLFAEYIYQTLKSAPTSIYEHDVGKNNSASGIVVCKLCGNEYSSYASFGHHFRTVHWDIAITVPKQSNSKNRQYNDYCEMKKT